MTKKLLPFLILSIGMAGDSFSQTRFVDGNITGPGGNKNDPTETVSGSSIGVDSYTGKFSAGFNLYKYDNQSTGLKHQITVNYDGSGILVDAMASEIGINWSLNVGGSITRETKGVPDDDFNGFTADQYPVPNMPQLNDSALLLKYIADNKDGQYDLFRFEAGGKSGKFIMGKNQQILTIPRSNIKITQISTGNAPYAAPLDSCNRNGFIITLEDGTQYVYSSFDCTEFEYHITETRRASKQWYLTKIIAPFGTESINFNYTPYINYYSSKGIVDFTLANSSGGLYDNLCANSYPNLYSNRTRSMRLDSINYQDGITVKFTYGFPRLDFKTSKALEKMDINKAGATKYGYKFNHSYIRRDNGGDNTPDTAYIDYSSTNPSFFTLADEQRFTLQLNGFFKYSGSEILPGYNFRYNDICPPKRNNSGSVDLWGYYNGAGLTNLNDSRTTQFNYNGYSQPGSSRLPSDQFASAKSMKSVYLPTGGTISIDLEGNTTKSVITPNDLGLSNITTVGGLRTKRLTYSDVTGQNNDMIKEYNYVETDGITSSGVMVNFPRFGYVYNETVGSTLENFVFGYTLITLCSSLPGNQLNTSRDFMVRSGYPLNDLITTHGSLIGYGRVEEYDGTAANYLSKTVYKFTTPNDYPIAPSLLENNFPFPSIPSNDFAWGLPLSTEKYNSAGVLMSSNNNKYDVYTNVYNTDNFRGVKIGLKKHPPHNINDYEYRYYYPVSGKVFLSKTTSTKYFASNKMFKDSTTYTYDTLNNVLRYSIAGNANGDQIKTLFYYPFDFNQVSLPAIKALTISNAGLYTPIRKETWKLGNGDQLLDVSVAAIDTVNGSFLSGPPAIYNGLVRGKAKYLFTPAPNQVVTAAIWGTFNSGVIIPNPQLFSNIMSVDKYDVLGNILQTTKNSVTTSTIWDNKICKPISTINNANYNDVAFTSFEDNSSLGNWGNSIPITQVIAFTGSKAGVITNSSQTITKNNLDPAKTYVITYWIKGISPNARKNGITPIAVTSIDTRKGWTLYMGTFSGATSVNIVRLLGNGSTFIDEVRLYPQGAQMTSNTIDNVYGTTSINDPSNQVVYFEYDGFGRIKCKRDINGNILKTFAYKNQDTQY